MTLDSHTEARINSRFHALLGTDLDALLQPIEQANPSGEFLKGNGVYSTIKEARNADDPNLPMGDWQHNLKVADWDRVTQVAVDALTNKTKDLQIGIWLLEAQIFKHGFAGIAPAIKLLTEMTDKFWQDLHPQIDDGDIEYRTNLIAWLNDKLQPAVRQLLITQDRSDEQFCWADWEIAVHMEQLPEQELNKKINYLSCQQITQAISATPIEFYRKLYQDISDALVTLEQFSQLLDDKCQGYAPSVSAFATLLQEIRDTLGAQVQHRGLFAAASEDEADAEQAEWTDGAPPTNPPGGFGGPINSRESAYQQLAEAAEFLLREDPHSPVPYLIFKAIEWGNLNTAELYQQLFVQYQGQLNIFDMLGLEVQR